MELKAPHMSSRRRIQRLIWVQARKGKSRFKTCRNGALQLFADIEEEVHPRDSGAGEGCCAEGDPGSSSGFGGGVGVAGG